MTPNKFIHFRSAARLGKGDMGVNRKRMAELTKILSKNKKPQPKPEAFVWSGRRDSNPRHQPWQGCALPAELLPQ